MRKLGDFLLGVACYAIAVMGLSYFYDLNNTEHVLVHAMIAILIVAAALNEKADIIKYYLLGVATHAVILSAFAFATILVTFKVLLVTLIVSSILSGIAHFIYWYIKKEEEFQSMREGERI